MSNQRNNLNQLANRIIETATGEKLEVIGMFQEETMRDYLIIHNATKDDPVYKIFLEEVSQYKPYKMLDNVWFIKHEVTAEEIANTIKRNDSLKHFSFMITQLTENTDICPEEELGFHTSSWAIKVCEWLLLQNLEKPPRRTTGEFKERLSKKIKNL